MRVLLIRLGAMGDIVHTLPLLHALHGAGHEVDWLVEDRWADLLRGNPAIRHLITVPRKAWKQQQRGWWGKTGKICGNSANISNSSSITAASMPKAWPKVPCWATSAGHQESVMTRLAPESWLGWEHLASSARCNTCYRSEPRPSRPAATTAAIAADTTRNKRTSPVDGGTPTGLSCPKGACTKRNLPNSHLAFPLSPWTDEQQRMDSWLDEHDLRQSSPWALNVGAGWPSKVWPEQHQLSFIRCLIERGQRPLLIWGSPAEHDIAQRIQQAAPEAVLAPTTNLPELVCLIRRCRILISGGPVRSILR